MSKSIAEETKLVAADDRSVETVDVDVVCCIAQLLVHNGTRWSFLPLVSWYVLWFWEQSILTRSVLFDLMLDNRWYAVSVSHAPFSSCLSMLIFHAYLPCCACAPSVMI